MSWIVRVNRDEVSGEKVTITSREIFLETESSSGRFSLPVLQASERVNSLEGICIRANRRSVFTMGLNICDTASDFPSILRKIEANSLESGESFTFLDIIKWPNTANIWLFEPLNACQAKPLAF
jgi:hypothetical protein